MIIVDLETTGLDPERNWIASIGAVDFFNPSRTYYKECYVADETIISEESLKVTGFTVQSLRDRTKPSAQFLTKDFFNWCDIAAVKLLAGEELWLDASFLRV